MAGKTQQEKIFRWKKTCKQTEKKGGKNGRKKPFKWVENRQKKMEMSEKDGRKQSLNDRKDSHAKEQEKWE